MKQIWWRLQTAAFWGWTIAVPQAVAANRVIVIGIQDYIGNALTKPVQFAKNDAKLFNDFAIQKQLDQKPITLDSVEATLPRIQFELNRVLEQANRTDTVYIFISSRGIARPGLDGYLGTADMVGSKPESTALPVQYLRKLIEGSSAARVIVFADVCRNPPEPFSNQINKRVAELGSIAKPAVAGVLASQPGQTSEERADTRYPPGYGLFGFFLVNSGAAGNNGVPGVSSDLLKNLVEATKGKQKPSDFGAPPAKSAPLWRSAIDSRPTEWRAGFSRMPGQLASLFAAGLFFMQAQPSLARLDAIKAELLQRDVPVRDPLALAADLLSLRNQTAGDLWDEVDALAITRLASDAQTVVDRYGMDSFLPDDPLRVTPDLASRAAKEFEAALSLAPAGDKYRDFRQSLEVRLYLCRGLAGAIPDIGPLTMALGSPAMIPEVHNAIGIHYLESQPKNYEIAIREFQAAKHASPGWMYARHNLALAYIENGDYTAAEREYREAVATNPLQPYLYYNLGLLLHRMNRRGDAKTAYRKAWEIYGSTIAELRVRAAEWKDTLPQDSAVSAKRADVYEKSRAEVLNAEGALQASRGDSKSAREDYRNALMIDPDLCPARDNLAALEQAAVERANKTAVSTEALGQLDENLHRPACAAFYPSLLMRARLEKKNGALPQARADFTRVRELASSNTEALSGLAAVDAASGQFEQALGLLRQAIAIQTKPGSMAFPQLYVELAEVYRLQGNFGACRETYAQAMRASNGTVYEVSRRELRKRAACSPILK